MAAKRSDDGLMTWFYASDAAPFIRYGFVVDGLSLLFDATPRCYDAAIRFRRAARPRRDAANITIESPASAVVAIIYGAGVSFFRDR